MLSGAWDVAQSIISPPLVIIDDIEPSRTAGVTDELARIIERRIGKWTVYTSNLSLEQIGEQIDVRVASRLLRPIGRSVVVEIKTKDYALR